MERQNSAKGHGPFGGGGSPRLMWHYKSKMKGRNRMKKSILAILLALVMVASLLPFGALADDTWTEVDSAEEFSTALAAGGNIKLTGSFSVADEVNWVVSKNVVLDLNGNSIISTFSKSNYYLININGGALTILDSTTEKTGKIEVNASNSKVITLYCTGSGLTL